MNVKSTRTMARAPHTCMPQRAHRTPRRSCVCCIAIARRVEWVIMMHVETCMHAMRTTQEPALVDILQRNRQPSSTPTRIRESHLRFHLYYSSPGSQMVVRTYMTAQLSPCLERNIPVRPEETNMLPPVLLRSLSAADHSTHIRSPRCCFVEGMSEIASFPDFLAVLIC